RESRHMPVASPAASTVELIGQEFAAIPEVESVVISQHGDLVSVWTGVGSFDREIRSKIYKVERDLASQLRGLHFNFHVVDATVNEATPSQNFAYRRQSA